MSMPIMGKREMETNMNSQGAKGLELLGHSNPRFLMT